MSLRYEEKRFYKLFPNVVRKFIFSFVTIVIVLKQRISDILSQTCAVFVECI